MYLIVIAWTYVTLMMAVAEATNPQGSVLGAVITFVLYGLLPMGILVYILATPSRKRKIKAREAAEQAAYEAQQPAVAGQPSEGDDRKTAAEGLAHPDPAVACTPRSPASPAPDAGGKAPAAAEGSSVAAVRKEG